MKLKSNVEILEAAALAIDNIQKDPELQKKMAVLGFPQKRIQDGIALQQYALMTQYTQGTYYNEQWAISQQINKEVDVTITQFKNHVKVARIAFRDEGEFLHALKIDKFANGSWPLVRQAQHFYSHLVLNATAMDAYGISQAILEQAKASVDALLDNKRERTRKKGQAEDSTKDKQKAFAELKAWVVEFWKAARFAFRDKPQILESFGILVSSVK